MWVEGKGHSLLAEFLAYQETALLLLLIAFLSWPSLLGVRLRYVRMRLSNLNWWTSIFMLNFKLT
jgi:hypothetical protein